jgi:hypothetical protein
MTEGRLVLACSYRQISADSKSTFDSVRIVTRPHGAAGIVCHGMRLVQSSVGIVVTVRGRRCHIGMPLSGR